MLKKTAVSTSYLVATPSFLTGYARALDIAGTFDSYNTSESESEADEIALANDWRVVGSQMREAMAAQ